MTKLTKKHIYELIIRIILHILIILGLTYDTTMDNGTFKILSLSAVWFFYFAKIIARLIPTKNESMGNQKIFSQNFKPTKIKTIKRDNKPAILTAITWIIPNIIIWILYFKNIINKDILLIISTFFGICDLLCILIYCPFQKLLMKNRCCNTCRIYNWDFIMMFTPLFVAPNLYNWTLLGLSLIVFITWETKYYQFPERFHPETNKNLKCKNCKELMCKNKLRLIKDGK